MIKGEERGIMGGERENKKGKKIQQIT